MSTLMQCDECLGTGKTVRYPETIDDYCPQCLGSGCVLCSECSARVAYGRAHDGAPLCEGHMNIYYPQLNLEEA